MSGIFDLTNGGFVFGNNNGNTFMSQDGHLMNKTSDYSMMDLETGEMHLTSQIGGHIIGNDVSNTGMNNNNPFKLF